MKKIFLVVAILVLIGAAVGIYFYLTPSSSISFVPIPQGEQQQAAESSDASVGASSTVLAELPTVALSQHYTNSAYGFSFSYPEGFHVGDVDDQNGSTVLVQDSAGHIGFQIYITPYNGNTNLTADLIHQNLPDLHISNPQPINLASGGAGLAFLSDNSSLGNSREVWFAFKGNLYQISAYQSQDTLLQRVLGTWNFAAR